MSLESPRGLWREASLGSALELVLILPSALFLNLTPASLPPRPAPRPRPCSWYLGHSLQFLGRNLPSDTPQGPGWAFLLWITPLMRVTFPLPLLQALSSCNTLGWSPGIPNLRADSAVTNSHVWSWYYISAAKNITSLYLAHLYST